MASVVERNRMAWLASSLLLAGTTAVPARAEDRSVTIIEGMPEPVQPQEPRAPPAGAELRTTNPAGVRLDLIPGAVLPVGTNVVFRVATQRPGYLVLVDINANKIATQIYPNVLSLTQFQVRAASANLLKPGIPMTIPDLKNPLARFIFRSEPPLGRGIIVAVLSDQPVQLIDLPELPADIGSPQASVDALDQALRKLLVSQADHPGKFDQNAWSLAAVEYVVK